jgi:PAS domain S-box-containing protein
MPIGGALMSADTLAGPVASRVLPWPRRRVLVVAVAFFLAIAALRLTSDDPSKAITTFYLLPIAVLGLEFGLRGGVLGGLAATALVLSWALLTDVTLGAGEVISRCVLFLLLGGYFGYLGTRLSQAVSDRAKVADQTHYMEGLTTHGLVRLDPSGSITGWNPVASAILGYSEAEARSKPLTLILGGEDDPGTSLRAMLDGAVRRGLWDERRWVVRKDGQHVWAAVSVTPLAGVDAGFALVLRNLKAEQAQRHDSSRMWQVSLEMLATIRPDGCFQQVNPRWEEVLGWTADELVATPSAEYVHPDDLQRTAAETSKLRGGGHETVSFENRHRCRDGSYRWLLWNSMYSPEDELVYAAAHDITERKEQQAALATTEIELRSLSEELESRVERRTSELADANRELKAFSYSVSHDLRAPLRAIDGYSQVLLEDYAEALPEGAQSDLARVRAATQRMATMIDEMLALSRVTRQELHSEPVDLSELGTQIVGELGRLEGARQVDVAIEPGLDVTGDPVLLQLVLYNLLENAWKFTADTAHAHVELSRIGAANGHSTFAVRDNGAGFDMRYAEKLFRPFERLHRQEEYPGTGVGLTTVERILSRHGGRIWAEGTPGHGAVFFFDLPTRQDPHA